MTVETDSLDSSLDAAGAQHDGGNGPCHSASPGNGA